MDNDGDSPFDGPLEMPGDDPRPQQPFNKKRRGPGKKRLFILVGLLLLAGIGYGAWKSFGQKLGVNKAPSAAPAAPAQSNNSNDTAQSAEIKTYKADTPNIEFKYPSSWTVTAKEGGIRIESPKLSYKTTDASDVSGNFRIYIRQGARTADSKYIGRGVAIKPSEKISYTQPAPGQRPDTNLSSFGIDTPDYFAFFFVAGNYTLKKGDSLGPNYGKEAETYIIAGGYSSKDLTDDLATNKVPLDAYDQTNAYKQALEIIKSLKLL